MLLLIVEKNMGGVIMQIQKGLVKYKDRNDIVCTYGITEEGSQYYFLDVDKLPNGNIIASTALVEAIDSSVVPSALGVIDVDGKIVVPFANKMIKPINDNILLVERAQPMTESVLENIKLRTDPLSATKLVTIPSNIKDKLNKKMGVDGEFIFNDQFSEATICDMDGNNLVDNQYFSFIGMDKNTLYFSTNILDSSVVSYSIPTKDALDNKDYSKDVEKKVELIPDKKSLDINNIDVNKTAIDAAINKEMEQSPKNDINPSMPPLDDIFNKKIDVDENKDNDININGTDSVIKVDDNVKEENSDDKSLSKFDDLNLSVDNSSESGNNKEEKKAPNDSVSIDTDSSSDVLQVSKDDVKVSNEEAEIKQPLFGELISNKSSEDEDDSSEEEKELSLDSNNNVNSEDSSSEQDRNDPLPLNNTINDSSASDNSKVIDNFPSIKYFGEDDDEEEESDSSEGVLNIDAGSVISDESSIDDSNSIINSDYDDIDLDLEMNLNTDIDSDSYTSSNDYISDYNRYSSVGGTKDSIIEDVAVTMSNLINLNRDQQKKIGTCEEQIKQLSSSHKKIAQKARNQMREIDLLKTKLQNYESIVNKLEARNQVLDDRVHDQEKTISSQSAELDELRPQVEGKEELVKLIVDAQNILGKDKIRV